MKRLVLAVSAVVLGVGLWSGAASPAWADDLSIGRYYYYPFYYFPHNYWPQQGPQWPEPPGAPYMRPPAWMAYPPFLEPYWRYEAWKPMRFYRGSHFWLDQF